MERILTLALVAGTVLAAATSRPERRGRNGSSGESKSLESAEYQQIQANENYEIRDYGNIRVVATSKDKTEDNTPTPFFRLYSYIDGQNSQDVKIPMTRPVITKTDTRGVKIMSFVVPKAYKTNTPVPNNPDVKVVDLDVGQVYVKRFLRTSKASDKDLEEMRKNLLDTLSEEGFTDYEPNTWFNVGYNAPFKPEQTYEIWLKRRV